MSTASCLEGEVSASSASSLSTRLQGIVVSLFRRSFY